MSRNIRLVLLALSAIFVLGFAGCKKEEPAEKKAPEDSAAQVVQEGSVEAAQTADAEKAEVKPAVEGAEGAEGTEAAADEAVAEAPAVEVPENIRKSTENMIAFLKEVSNAAKEENCTDIYKALRSIPQDVIDEFKKAQEVLNSLDDNMQKSLTMLYQEEMSDSIQGLFVITTKCPEDTSIREFFMKAMGTEESDAGVAVEGEGAPAVVEAPAVQPDGVKEEKVLEEPKAEEVKAAEEAKPAEEVKADSEKKTN